MSQQPDNGSARSGGEADGNNNTVGKAARPETAAVILAAGRGQRFGRRKQFEQIEGVTLVERVVATAQQACDYVVLVLPVDYQDDPDASSLNCLDGSVHCVVPGGGSHGKSAQIGLSQVPASVDIVILASASHPLAGPDLYRRTIEAVAAGADAAAPMALLADAVKERDGNQVVRSIPKVDLVMAQSPCAFDRTVLVEAYERMSSDDRPLPPEELEMIEGFGGTVALVEGEPTNIHVTTPMELEIARRLAELVPGGSIAKSANAGNSSV